MVERDEFETLVRFLREDIQDGFKGVHIRLDALNGRTRLVETRVAVLEDRGDQARDPAARRTAVGAVVSGIVLAIIQWFSSK